MSNLTARLEGDAVAQAISDLKSSVERMRRNWERRWYDANFFDDGYHFRYVHRATGQITDTSKSDKVTGDQRVIPKASRQIRGIANLLMSFNFHPVVYPRKVTRTRPQIYDPESGQVLDPPEYTQQVNEAKDEARKLGLWLADEWDQEDLLAEKIPWMVLLAEKNSASFMEFYYDDVFNRNCTHVFDAFDTYLLGNLKNVQDSPFVGFSVPTQLRDIIFNEKFNEEARNHIMVDNKLADSLIKEGYESTKYSNTQHSDLSPTVILRKFYIKEAISEENLPRIQKQKDADAVLDGRSMGDIVVRNTYTAGGKNLYDQYLNIPLYPVVDFKMEPGQIWQTPQIERFMDSNKALDMVVTRIERFVHTMNVGVWLKKAGEQFKISNAAGGLLVTYSGTPPRQMQLATLPPHLFEFVNLLESLIEEQGVTTTTLGKIPAGVKANAAIESLKASEFANLTININMLKRTVQRIAEMQIMLAAKNYIKPNEVEKFSRGNYESFDVMGQAGVDAYAKTQTPIPAETVVVDANRKVKVEVETGSGYTVEAKRENVLEFAKFFAEVVNSGAIQVPAMKGMIEKAMETWQYGSLSDFADDATAAPNNAGGDIKEQVKIGMLEVLKDLKDRQSGEGGGGTPPPAAPVL